MFDRFTERARHVVIAAQDAVRELAHPHVGTEHLLLGQLGVENGLGAWALESLGVQRGAAMAALASLVPPTRTPPDGQVPFTAGTKCALELSLVFVQSRCLEWVGTEHLLLAVCDELDAGDPDGDVARSLLGELDLTTARIRAAVQPYMPWRPLGLAWSVRRAPALQFRRLPSVDLARVLPAVPAGLPLRRLLVDSAAVALDAGRSAVESADVLVAAGGGGAGTEAAVGAGAGGDWTRVVAGLPVISALVRAGRVAEQRGAEAVTVEDLVGTLRTEQRHLLARHHGPAAG